MLGDILSVTQGKFAAGPLLNFLQLKIILKADVDTRATHKTGIH